MFIDYVALMVVALVIGLVTLAVYLALYFEAESRKIAPGLILAGFILLATGLHLIFTWPLPASYNVSFGEPAVLFATLLVGAGAALMAGWDLLGFAVFAFPAGVVALVVGVRLIDLQQTNAPVLAGLGYILPGIVGLLSPPIYFLRRSLPLRVAAAALLLIAAAVWAFIGYGAYWLHLQSFAEWKPFPMR